MAVKYSSWSAMTRPESRVADNDCLSMAKTPRCVTYCTCHRDPTDIVLVDYPFNGTTLA